MKNLIKLMSIILIVFMADTVFSETTQIYSHPNPKLNISFEAPEDWKEISWYSDRNAYEVSSPDEKVHILLWYTETVQYGPDYLRKMADMKDLKFDKELSKTIIHDKEAWMTLTSGKHNNVPIKLILTVIETDWSGLPNHNALYIIQIWCPKNEHDKYSELMKQINGTVRVSKPPQGK